LPATVAEKAGQGPHDTRPGPHPRKDDQRGGVARPLRMHRNPIRHVSATKKAPDFRRGLSRALTGPFSPE
jgi:hypothetical protein